LAHPKSTLKLRYIRLPDRTMELNDELVFRSGKVIVGRSQVSSENSVAFDGQTVLAPSFRIVYFELLGKWFTVDKVWNLQGKHTGYYCDIVMPPRLKGDWLELTDLFLDLWVSPDLRYKVLDEDELEEALKNGWIRKELHDKAKYELQKLIRAVENRRFPPRMVKNLERKLNL
jgi:predicted RNA-binding protein associated with RNAse of E/G family